MSELVTKDKEYEIDDLPEVDTDIESKLDEKEKKRHTRRYAKIKRNKNKMFENRMQKENKLKHKSELKEIKNNNEENENINTKKQRLRWYNFFTRWFFIGSILILFSLCLTLTQSSLDTTSQGLKILSGFLDVAIGLLSSIGIALLVSSVFDFSKNSEAFTNFVSNIIKKIIVTKEFLCEIKEEEKRKVLEMLIAPTDTQIEQCSSINLYYKKSIDDFFNLYNQPFKTNLVINIFAKIEDEKVVCEGNISSRRYKIKGEFPSVTTSFEKENSQMDNAYILLPNGEKKKLKCEPSQIDEEEKEKMAKKYVNEIPDEMNRYPYITVGKNIKEIGNEEYILFNWSSLTPCDGVTFELNCIGELEIMEYKIFDDHNLYEVDLNENNDNIRIMSNSWLNKYTGFTLLIKKVEKREKV